MKHRSLKFLLACSAAIPNLFAAATMHESSPVTRGSNHYLSRGEVRVPAEEWRQFKELYERMTSHATPASPVASKKTVVSPVVNEVGSLQEPRSVELSMDGINLYNNHICLNNSQEYLDKINRFVTAYQTAGRTDSLVVDLSKNFIDGGFLESLIKTLDPIKDRISELRLDQNKLYLRSVEQLAPLLMLDSFKYLTVYSNFMGDDRLLAFGAGIYDEEADNGYDAAYLIPAELLNLSIHERRICLQKMIWIPKSYFKDKSNPTNVPTVEGIISRDEILRIHRTYFSLPELS